MKRKLILSIFTFVLMFLSFTTVTYAYWNVLAITKDETIVVGQGVSLNMTVEAVAPIGKTLVPAGCVVDSATQVDSITLTYNVKLSRTLTADLTLSVTPSNVRIGEDATNAGLVGFAITLGAPTVNNADVLVTVTVTLVEPESQAIYDVIINKDIKFDLNFTAA